MKFSSLEAAGKNGCFGAVFQKGYTKYVNNDD